MIRIGTKEDIPEVSGLWLSMVEELAANSTPNISWWKEIAEKSYESGVYNLFVAVEMGCIVGFIDYFLFPEPYDGKIHMVGQHLYVFPEYRGTSIASLLYKNALKDGKNRGAEVAELFCFTNEKSMWERKGYSSIRSLVRKFL